MGSAPAMTTAPSMKHAPMQSPPAQMKPAPHEVPASAPLHVLPASGGSAELVMPMFPRDDDDAMMLVADEALDDAMLVAELAELEPLATELVDVVEAAELLLPLETPGA